MQEYLGIDGLPEFVRGCRNIVFGQESQLVREKCIASVQTLSGAGAIRIGLEFLSQYLKAPVYVSNPSWPIHEKMAKRVGLRCEEYPYYSYALKNIDFSKMMQFLKAGENGAIVILHASAHNPTGIDLTQPQWK